MSNPFYQILGNNLIANITNFTVWFAITFWIFLETHSVFATGMVAGLYLVFTAGFGFWLGSIVDHNPKKLAMQGSSLVSFGFYGLRTAQSGPQHEPPRKLLGQRCGGKLLQPAQSGTHPPQETQNPRRSPLRRVRLHRVFLQPSAQTR